MFESEDQLIEMWVKVGFTVADLTKANSLKLMYDYNNLPYGLVDEQGNEYTPMFALECNEGSEEPITHNEIFKSKFGLSVDFYYDSGISEPYYSEEE